MDLNLNPNPKWNIDISNELHNRKRKCQLKFGPLNEYIYPKQVDPYFYPSVDTFKRANPFKDNNLNCKFIKKNTNNERDENNRYYEKIHHRSQCIEQRGKWEENAINRDNRYDKGVCWTNKEDAYCGTKYQYTPALRPKEVRKDINMNINKAKNICNIDPRCTHHKIGEYSYDCFAKKPKIIQISQPPLDMPTHKIENYIENWYTKNKPSLSPETSELFGKGNRCKNEDNEENEINNISKIYKTTDGQNALRYFSFIRKKILLYDPRKKDDYKELEKYMNESNLKKYTKDYNLNKNNLENILIKYAPEYFTEIINDHIKSLVDKKIHITENHMKPKLSIPQSVVNMVMKNISNKKSRKRGMLAWHSTGSGKTCTATGVIDAFWDEKDRSIIFTSSIDAIASNPDYKFHECALNLFPRFKSNLTNDLAMKKISEDFDKRDIRFLSFAKLSNRIKKSIDAKKDNIKIPKDDFVDLNKSILIIDEVHNLFRPLATQRKQHEFLEKQLLNTKKYPGLKIVILTATPGDNIIDIIKLLNIIKDINKPLIIAPNPDNSQDIEIFKESIRDMISFFDMSSDYTKFPLVEDEIAIKYPMSKIQFDKYIEAYRDSKPTSKNFEKLAKLNQINKYWSASRKYSNMMYNFDKDMKLSDFSSKLPALLKNIQLYNKHKQYVYSAFYEKRGYGGQGILAIAKELDKLGYIKLTVKEAKKLNSQNKLPIQAKRYILAITSEIGESSSTDKSTSGENLHELIKIYNSPENKNGELIHVFLASQGFNEGIDLKAVRHIHIFEPLVTWASDKQTIGRAARYCSHQDLDRNNNEWKVNIHRYISDFPDDIITNNIPINTLNNEIEILKKSKNLLEEALKKSKIKKKIKLEIIENNKKIHDVQVLIKNDISDIKNIEDTIFKESRERMKSLLVIYQAMKDAAIDCNLLNKFHGSSINCLQNNKEKNMNQ